ncbi:MAG TPA: CDP-alcohol phosphatidyltransferase family protein [Jatrophihabitans sp.]|nr:CDP-alcohol phosphatidyltransferase family protein [Jatrophihabitans sp.]
MEKLQTSAPVLPGRYATARGRLAGAQKSTASVPAYLRFVNRRAGGWLASIGYALDRTPTQLTVLSALCSFAGIAVLLFAPATVPVGVVVAALLLLGYALDSADGQLARIRGGGSKAGEWLDHVVDMAKLSSLHAVVAVSVLRYFDVSWLVLAIPLAFGIANATQFLGMMLRDQLRRSAGARSEGARSRADGPAGSANLLRSWLLLPLDHGTLCLAFLLLGYHRLFLVAYGLLALCTVAFAGRSLAKAYRGLLALDRLGSPG